MYYNMYKQVQFVIQANCTCSWLYTLKLQQLSSNMPKTQVFQFHSHSFVPVQQLVFGQ